MTPMINSKSVGCGSGSCGLQPMRSALSLCIAAKVIGVAREQTALVTSRA